MAPSLLLATALACLTRAAASGPALSAALAADDAPDEGLGLAQLRARRLQPQDHAGAMPISEAASQPGPVAEFVELRPPADADFGHPDWLEDCSAVLLDLGSGLGVNARKLFEPKKYEKSQLLPVFDATFGSPGWRRAPFNKTGLCALGLEPNPAHQGHLQRLERAYFSQGWHVHFYPFAAWSSNAFMPFNATGMHAPGPEDSSMQGAHLAMDAHAELAEREGDVRTVDLADFIESLPDGSVKVMAMDIEGAEYETLALLLQRGAMCGQVVGQALVQANDWGSIKHWASAKSFPEGVHPRSFGAVAHRLGQLKEVGWCAPGNVTAVSELDDTAYSLDVGDWLSKADGQHGL